MDEIEDKYKQFALDENMKELFSHATVNIDDGFQAKTSFIISTFVIDHLGKSTEEKERDDAKLV